MLDRGILREDEPVELIDGSLILVPPQQPRHAWLVSCTTQLFAQVWGENAHVRCQCPLQASDLSMPEPDVAVLRGSGFLYRDRHPTGADAILVVEFSFSTERLDRHKARVYAGAGVPEYWMVVPEAKMVHVFREPVDGRYRRHEELRGDECIELPGTGRHLTPAALVGDEDLGEGRDPSRS
jgi:Uma2 family endonuclease